MKRYLLLLLLSATACQPTTEPTATAAPTTTAAPAALPAAPGSASATEPLRVAGRFMRWYQLNLKQIQQKQNSVIEGGDTTGTSFYQLSQPNADRYLAALRGSGCVSEAYLAQWRRHILRWGDSLRVHPQNDGPPPGFEFDFVTRSQEWDEYLNGYSKAPKQTTFSAPDRALITARYSFGPDATDQRLFYLGRYPAGWLIDSINVP